MFQLLFCSHHQADRTNIKKATNTASILIGDLGPYSVLYKVYNIHNLTKNEIVGFKMYNYKTLYAWVTAAVYSLRK